MVATSAGGPREFVSHGVDGYHVHPTPNSLSWGICEIFSNFENARQMGLRGRQKVNTVIHPHKWITYPYCSKCDDSSALRHNQRDDSFSDAQSG